MGYYAFTCAEKNIVHHAARYTVPVDSGTGPSTLVNGSQSIYPDVYATTDASILMGYPVLAVVEAAARSGGKQYEVGSMFFQDQDSAQTVFCRFGSMVTGATSEYALSYASTVDAFLRLVGCFDGGAAYTAEDFEDGQEVGVYGYFQSVEDQ